MFALSESFDGEELAAALDKEARARGLALGEAFSLPEEWGSAQEAQYARLARQTSLPQDVATMAGGLSLAGRFLDPVLSGSYAGMIWTPCSWVPAPQE